jgi:hypothetical protein
MVFDVNTKKKGKPLNDFPFLIDWPPPSDFDDYQIRP